ncbi:MAG TPA: RES family NAD+ phosphorylase [Mucilaginibacter sp.]|jgi:RES domain-containing protein|nr:RES family NAD+ phosphorylase [Mucilaginibacter sp.]
MILYRLTRCVYAEDLSGTGGRLFGGRWHSMGKPAIYLASSAALALLEVLVHLQPLMIPDDYCLLEMEVPEDSISQVSIDYLPSNWKDISAPMELKEFGDAFLKRRAHLLMKVPSSIVPMEYNYLLNPLHPDIKKVRVLKKEPFDFDSRLV